MNALEWLMQMLIRQIRPVYAVYGDDTYLIRESIRALLALFADDEERESGISRFPGPTSSLANVLDEVSTLPFFIALAAGDRRRCRPIRDEISPRTGGVCHSSVHFWDAGPAGQAVDCDDQAGCGRRKGWCIDQLRSPRERELAAWLTQLARTRHDTQLMPMPRVS